MLNWYHIRHLFVKSRTTTYFYTRYNSYNFSCLCRYYWTSRVTRFNINIQEGNAITIFNLIRRYISFIKRNVILGYIVMFFPLYLFILATLLIPFEGGWAIFFIPGSVITFFLSKLKAEMLSPFKIKKKNYNICHFCAYAFSVIIGALLRFAVIIPYMEALNS